MQEVLATSRETGYRHLEGVAERLLAESLTSPSEAAPHLERGLRILEEIDARNEVAKALMGRAKLQAMAGHVEEAERDLERAIEIFERLGTIDGPLAARASLTTLRIV